MRCHKTLLCATLLFAIGISSKASLAEWDGYQPIPEGFDFGDKAFRDKFNTWDLLTPDKRPELREHAWRVWVGTMQSLPNDQAGMWKGWPVTRSWPITPDVLDNENLVKNYGLMDKSVAVSALGASAYALQSPHVNTGSYEYKPLDGYSGCADYDSNKVVDGKYFQSNGDIMIPLESFSIEAYNYIRDNKIYTVDGMNEHKGNIHFPQDSVLTKQMLWPVKQDGISALPIWEISKAPIWNEQFSGPDPYGFTGYAGYELWNKAVGVAVSAPEGRPFGSNVNLEYLYAKLIARDGAPEIPTPIRKEGTLYSINDFYNAQVTQEIWDELSEDDKVILNATSCWANARPFKVNDYLITVAMHTITKEIEPWTLQTAWWSDQTRNNNIIYNQNRPDDLPSGAWGNYMLSESSNIKEANGKFAIAVNPYIEGVIHPIATNCRNCHSRAGWPNREEDEGATEQRSVDGFPACYDILGIISEGTPEQQKACMGKNAIRTDFSWVLGDRVTNSKQTD